MPNPIDVAYKCRFRLDTPIDVKKRRHIGTCICGTRGSVSYDSFVKEKFCRNTECDYYQHSKQLDIDERKIIAEERGCYDIEIEKNGVNEPITFTCECGFRQTNKWITFYKDKWCKYYNCKHYYKQKEFDNQLLIEWFSIENYTVPSNFKHKKGQHHDLTCPKGHTFNCSIDMWINGARCKVCNGDGRTLSYQEIKKFYELQGCQLLYTEDDYKGNITTQKVPYICSNGHTISNLTKNCFNNRINSNIGPCSVCNIEETYCNRKLMLTQALEKHNSRLIDLNKDRSIKYICSCGKECKTFDSNVLKDNFIGCATCANPFNKKEIQDKIKQSNLDKYGVENNFQREDIKKKIKQTNLDRYGVENVMQDGKIFALQKNNAYSKKPYSLPSGKIVYIMGYEDRCIEYLLQNYTEEQLVIDDNEKPKIMYSNPLKNGRKSRYYPDLYIPSENIVIEVKSDFTLEKEYEQNMKKFEACVELGYKLLVYVFNKKRLMYIDTYTKDDFFTTLFLES